MRSRPRCQCARPIESLERNSAFTHAMCQRCGNVIAIAKASFNFDTIDWDEIQFPAGGPYAGRTYKEVAATDPGFFAWYAENVNDLAQREIARKVLEEVSRG